MSENLEIRYPERGRKPYDGMALGIEKSIWK